MSPSQSTPGTRATGRPPRFVDRAVIVTGAAQGIGRGVAERIAAEGGAVLCVDRSGFLDETVAAIAAAGGWAAGFEADLETFAGAEAMVEAALQRWGRVDILINNVGGTIWTKPYDRYAPEEIEREIRRSLFTTLWGCRAVLPHMVQRKAGVIVNVSSIATRSLFRAPYAAAKGGVNALTASLAMEHARNGVRVVATAPGGTEAPPRKVPRHPGEETEEEKSWYRGIVEQTKASSLMGRYGTIEEQVGPILFMASDEASYVTGSVLPVGGGDLG